MNLLPGNSMTANSTEAVGLTSAISTSCLDRDVRFASRSVTLLSSDRRSTRDVRRLCCQATCVRPAKSTAGFAAPLHSTVTSTGRSIDHWAHLGFSTGRGSGLWARPHWPYYLRVPSGLRLSVFVVFGGFSQGNRQPEAFSHRRGGDDSPCCADNWSDGHQDPLCVFES